MAAIGILATLALLTLGAGLSAVLVYDRLVALSAQVREAWSDVEVQLAAART
ncbi:MAG: hypothetical protein ACK4PG_13850 [Acetobacteraceae bacterium]